MKIKRSLMKYRGDHCLNCDYPLEISDRYCPRCGQMNSTKKLSLEDFFEEFFSGFFAYDSRLHRTLSALLFKPGKISKDYIQGKRTRYANPFRFYLSASILFFLIYSFTASMNFGDTNFDDADNLARISPDSIHKIEEVLNKQGLNEDQKKIRLDSLIAHQAEAKKTSYKDVYVKEKSLDTMNFFQGEFQKFDIFTRYYKETSVNHPEAALDSLNYSQTRMNTWIYRKAMDWNTIKAKPDIFINYFIGKLPFIIFFYLPFFAVFIWLLYIRRPFNYMEHLIFTFHVQTVFFVLFGIAYLIDYITGANYAFGTAIFIFLFYLYKAMRNFYGQGRVKTIVKFLLMNLIFFILAIVAAVVSIFASFAIF
ncbi:MAG: DUF3667 domain-containing protein [Salegentibacter sp.]